MFIPTANRIVELDIFYIIIIIYLFEKLTSSDSTFDECKKKALGFASYNSPLVFQGQTGFALSECETKYIFSLMVESSWKTDRVEMDFFFF